jgi:hypothetical protein
MFGIRDREDKLVIVIAIVIGGSQFPRTNTSYVCWSVLLPLLILLLEFPVPETWEVQFLVLGAQFLGSGTMHL